ncbi:MAG: glycosyl hydrolase, partial [Sphingobacteriales bacterium]
ETIASGNAPEYIQAAFDYGLKTPIGMCLQDAGWEWGPWLKGKQYKPSIYTTWRNYFENVVNTSTTIPEWKFNQEDVLVSLVWGSQILQHLAQNVRIAENNIVQAEKVAVMNAIVDGKAYPSAKIDDAWQQLLLAQHHDSWIVPYNGNPGDNWADKVKNWTGVTNSVSNAIIEGEASTTPGYVKVYNTSGYDRTDYVKIPLAENFAFSKLSLQEENKQTHAADIITEGRKKFLRFRVSVPAFGFKVLKIDSKAVTKKSGLEFKQNKNIVKIEGALYTIVFDTNKGGAITSLIAKKLNNKEFVDKNADGQFSGLRGNFYNDGGLQTTFDKPAQITVKAHGEDFIQVEV